MNKALRRPGRAAFALAGLGHYGPADSGGFHVADIFDEVSEDLRAERAQRLLQRYGYLLIVAAVLIVAAMAGWKYWDYRQAQARTAVADAFLTASRQAATPGDARTAERAQAAQAFDGIAANGPGGYQTLARLREAALKAAGGDVAGALLLWDKVSADTAADPDLRHVADLLWVQHQLDGAEPAAVEGRLVRLLAAGPWRPLALECQAWLRLRTGDRDGAVAILKQIMALPSTPAGVRARASGLLTQLGEAPAAAPSENNG